MTAKISTNTDSQCHSISKARIPITGSITSLTKSNIQVSCHIMPTDSISRQPGRTNSWGKTPGKGFQQIVLCPGRRFPYRNRQRKVTGGETEEGNTAQIAEISAQEVLQQFQAEQKYPRFEAKYTQNFQPHGHRKNRNKNKTCDTRCALYFCPGFWGCIA